MLLLAVGGIAWEALTRLYTPEPLAPGWVIGVALAGDLSGRGRDALVEARDLTETTLRGVRDLSQLLHPAARAESLATCR